MLLFVDRMPLYSWLPAGAEVPRQSACVPILLSEAGLDAPPPHAKPQRWAIDTRFTGEAFAWRHHLLECGLNPDARRRGITQLTPLASNPRPFLLCDVDLWLVSNIPALRDTPWRLELDEGVTVHDVPYLSNPDVNCPLLGMRALRRAGLCLQIDFVQATVSVWVPAPWPRRLAVTLRRCLSGFRTLPAP